jgi:hypothetical protein
MKKTILSLGLLLTFSTYVWCQTELDVHSGFSDLLAYNSTALSFNTAAKQDNETGMNSLESDLLDGPDGTVTLTFYPNPVKDVLNVRFKEKGNYTIRIYNIVGEKIREKSVLENDIVRFDDLSSLPNGMYFLSYEPEYGRVVTKTFSKGQFSN